MNIIRETQSNLREESIRVRQGFRPRSRGNINTSGKNRGLRYTDNENFVIAVMARLHKTGKRMNFPYNDKTTKSSEIEWLANYFNRTRGSISGAMGNANYELFRLGSMTNSSASMKKVCKDLKSLSIPQAKQMAGDILSEYETNEVRNRKY